MRYEELVPGESYIETIRSRWRNRRAPEQRVVLMSTDPVRYNRLPSARDELAMFSLYDGGTAEVAGLERCLPYYATHVLVRDAAGVVRPARLSHLQGIWRSRPAPDEHQGDLTAPLH